MQEGEKGEREEEKEGRREGGKKERENKRMTDDPKSFRFVSCI